MQSEGDIMAAEITEGAVIEVSEVVRGARSESTDDLVIDLRPDVDEPDAASDEPAVSDDDVAGSPRQVVPGPLNGRIAVVTGGALGVGREVALGLARAGARVCVLGREIAQLRETVDLAGPEAAVLFLQCDVGSVSEIDGVVDFIERFDRPIDLLVHAEGVQVRGGVEHGSITDLDEQYLVNVRGPYLMTQRLLASLRSAHGHVVFVSASTSVGDDVDFGQFAVTSHGVVALADTLRREVEAAGVRVTTIQPEAPTADPSTDSVVALTPADIARSVLHAVELPAEVEITDIRLRPRRVAAGDDSSV